MQAHVITVTPEAPLPSAYRLFATEDLSGSPVVEVTAGAAGVASWRDRIRSHAEGGTAARGLVPAFDPIGFLL